MILWLGLFRRLKVRPWPLSLWMDVPGRVDYAGDVDGDEKIDYWLRKTHCPAVILEPEFIQQGWKIRQHREACCEALAGALV